MKFENSLNSHCRRGVAACSSASEAVRGCEEEGCEEEGYVEEEGGDEGRRMERERERVTEDRGGDSVSFVWRL